MAWQVTTDPSVFVGAVAPLLAARRVELTVPAGIVDTLRRRGPSAFGDFPPVLAWWDDGTGPSAVAVRTPPHPLVVSDLVPDAVGPQVTAIGPVAAATGPEASATGVVAASGLLPRVAVRERLHRLGALAPLHGVAGYARVAGDDDAALVASWWAAFAAEARLDLVSPTRPGLRRRRRGPRRAVDGGSRGPVDGRGAPAGVRADRAGLYAAHVPAMRYGAGAVTAACSLLRGRGDEEVLLFTDLANRTSNALYARIGFVGVLNLVEVVS